MPITIDIISPSSSENFVSLSLKKEKKEKKTFSVKHVCFDHSQPFGESQLKEWKRHLIFDRDQRGKKISNTVMLYCKALFMAYYL